MHLAAWFPHLLLAAADPTAAQLREILRDLPNFASEIAYDFCPKLMNGETTLENSADLRDLGFVAKPESIQNVGFPGFSRLRQTRRDGVVTVGGVSGKVCEVTASGPSAGIAYRQMRGSVYSLGLDLEADPANSGPRDNGMVEALKMRYSSSGQVQVRFINTTAGEGAPSATFQIIFQEQ